MNEKLKRARIDLTLKYPWWASLVLRLDLIHDEQRAKPPMSERGTMATDGRHVYYSQEFVDELNKEELIGVLVHEALHCGFLHVERIGERNPGKWNAAGDYAINGILIEVGQALPSGSLWDEKYNGMTADEIYNLLPDSYNSCDWGWVMEGDGEDLTEEGKTQWRDALSHSLTELRKRGKINTAWDRMLESAMAPRVPWRELLSSLLQAAIGQEDYTWKKPSRRSHLVEVNLPGRFEYSCLPIGVVIDTSGSMGEAELSQAVSAIRQVSEDMKIEKIIVLEADDSVLKRTEIMPGDVWNPPSLRGGSGTSFIPAIMELDEERCGVIVYLTDLEGEFPYAPPITSVIWLTKTDNNTVPFGQVVKIV